MHQDLNYCIRSVIGRVTRLQEKFLLLRGQAAKRPAFTKQCADRASQAFLMGSVSLCSSPCVTGSAGGRPGQPHATTQSHGAAGSTLGSQSPEPGPMPHKGTQGVCRQTVLCARPLSAWFFKSFSVIFFKPSLTAVTPQPFCPLSVVHIPEGPASTQSLPWKPDRRTEALG